jgi:hypothetical protein
LLAFVVTTVALFSYWQRSPAQLRAAIRPIIPTPPDRLDEPF